MQLSPSVKDAIRLLYSGVKLGTTAGATVASGGLGGDEVPDIIFLILDSSLLSANITSVIRSGSAWSQCIYNIPWPNNPQVSTLRGPAFVQDQMSIIFKEIDAQPNARAIYSQLCASYSNILDSLAAAFGSIVSVFIPDSLGIPRVVVETTIRGAVNFTGQLPFDTLAWIYDHIPASGKEYLEDPEKLKEFLLGILSFITDLFPQRSDTFWTKAKKNVKRIGLGTAASIGPLVLTGGIAALPLLGAQTANILASTGITGQVIVDLIEKYAVPHVDSYVEIIQKVLPLTFATLLLLQHCKAGSIPVEPSGAPQIQLPDETEVIEKSESNSPPIKRTPSISPMTQSPILSTAQIAPVVAQMASTSQIPTTSSIAPLTQGIRPPSISPMPTVSSIASVNQASMLPQGVRPPSISPMPGVSNIAPLSQTLPLNLPPSTSVSQVPSVQPQQNMAPQATTLHRCPRFLNLLMFQANLLMNR